MTQLNTYFKMLRDEKKMEIKRKLANEFRDELNFAIKQEIYYKVIKIFHSFETLS